MEARAEQGVDDDVGALELLAGLTPCLGEEAQRNPAVAAVRTFAADGGDPAGVGVAPQDRVGDRSARPLHHRLDVVALLGGAHLVRRVERRQH